MSKREKAFKILKRVLIGIVIAAAAVFLAAYLAVHFVIVPKYNENAGITEDGGKREITDSDVFDMAKYFTDQQFVDNLKNIDTETAKAVLEVMTELDIEAGGDGGVSESNQPDKKPSANDEKNGSTAGNQAPSQPDAEPEKKQSAYERIMSSADADEISKGLAIIKKVDMAKINSLRRQGKSAELKQYLSSVLTQEEISVSLKLYNKYKHLL